MMGPAEAFEVLGLAPTGDAEVLRHAFLLAIRSSHPDVAGPDQGGPDPAELTEAYRVARLEVTRRSGETDGDRAAPSTAGSTHPTAPAPVATDLRAEDVVWVGAAATETFRLVVAGLDEIGEVTFVDRHSGLAQAMLTFVDGPICYVHVSLRAGTAPGSTEAAVTVESLQQEPAPPLAAVTALIFDAVTRAAGDPDVVAGA